MKGAGLRSRWPHWPVTLTVVGVIVAGGAAAVTSWPHAWWWLVVVIAVTAAVAPPVLAALSQVTQRRQEIGRAARTGLQGTIGTVRGKLPTAGTADLEARVHQTVLPIPYIHRDQEDAIRAHLRAGRPVLLIGPSMVGKTKMAARAIAEEVGSYPVAMPDTKTALADLEAHDITLQSTVIWLDDIDRLIGADGITDGALRRLAATGNIIVGTIRARAYDQFRPSDQLRLPEWDALSVFEHIFITRDLTQKEQERLAEAVDDPNIQRRIRAIGIGEYVGAARQVAEALELGAAGTDSIGYALVLAAADWRRCGMNRPIPASMLAPLARPHLDQRGQARLTDEDAFNTGLAWATRDINPNVSLLQVAGTDSYLLYDYALDLISAQEAPIPDSSWTEIISNANPAELFGLGYTAETIYHRSEIATHAWRKAANSGDAYAASMSGLGLAMLLQRQGDLEGAKDAYQKAIDSTDADAIPVAVLGLGQLLEGQGDEDGAKDAYQKAIDSGHHQVAPLAAVNLGLLLARQIDVQGAKDAWQKAIDSGDPDHAPMAILALGMLLAEQGDGQGAKDAYQKTIDSGHPDHAPMATFNLGGLLAKQGDVQGAKNAWQKIIDSGHPEMAPKAAFNLGGLLAEQGDVQGAKNAWQKAIDSGHTDHAPKAAFNLGRQLAEQEDVQGAKNAWQKAIDSGHSDHAPMAARNLGLLLAEQGDVQGAKDAYQKAIDSGHPDHAPKAAVGLGQLLAGQGDVQGAKDAWQNAINSGHPQVAPIAAYNLGGLLAGQGDVQGAKDAYQKAINSGHPEVAPIAALYLRRLLATER